MTDCKNCNVSLIKKASIKTSESWDADLMQCPKCKEIIAILKTEGAEDYAEKIRA